MTLWRRIVTEQRPLVLALAAALVVNLAAWVLVVRPLERRSAGASERARQAAIMLSNAERELASTRALVEGKSRAEQELATFYDKVVPPDLAAARRMTYATLPGLARKARITYEQRRFEVEPPEKGSRLGQLRIRMVLQGDYDGVRRFIYALETAPEFVILDDVTLTLSDPNKPLTLAVAISTYYRLGANER